MSTALKERLKDDLVRSRKSRDRFRTLLLSTVLSEIRNREIEIGADAGDDVVRSVLTKAVKQRREAAEQMNAGARPDLAETEANEAKVLAEYLPPPLTEADVRPLVLQAVAEGATQMGSVMGRIMPLIKGRFDGKEANRIVREALGQ